MVTLWQNNRSFEETNLLMLQNEVLCDVTLLAGSHRQVIRAHKFILASRSAVFYAMFCNSSDKLTDTIEVADVDFEVLKEIVRFIYSENCDINSDTVMPILTGAKKYNISRLEEKCRTFLIDILSAGNVCTILKSVHDLEEKGLEQKCLSFITETGNDVLTNNAFAALSKSLIRKIIISDTLQSDEGTVYEACKKWAAENCKSDISNAEPTSTDLRNKLGDLIHLIRFPSMSFETFAACASKDDILTADEKVSIFQCIANKSTPADCKFLVKARIRKPNVKKDRIIIRRFVDAPSKHWMYNGLVDSINFIVSEKVKCDGVSLFSPINVGKVVGIVQLESAKFGVLFERRVEINYNASEVSEEVLFDDGVELIPGVLYTLKCEFKGPYTYYGIGGRKNVSEGNITVTFKENDFSQNGTDCHEGQFHYLIFQAVGNDS